MASNGILSASQSTGLFLKTDTAQSRVKSRISVTKSEGRKNLEEPTSNRSEIVLNSLTSGRAPSLSVSGPIAAFRVNDAIRLLNQNNKSTESPTVVALKRSPRFGGLQSNRLEGVRVSLNNLASSVDELLSDESLNTRKGKNSRRDLVELSVSRTATPSISKLVPTRRAVENTLVSDKQSSPTALGRTGSFSVNGFKINVVASDSIFEIRDKINFGEDANKNGRLDGPEDLNENGAIDIIDVAPREYGAGRYVIEDSNGNGVLDPDEDTNGNDRLDGGSDENNVSAVIYNDRLVLTGTAGTDKKIDLLDPDGILLELGFFELNSKGSPILKERQFDLTDLSVNPAGNLIKNPVFAQIELDDQTLESDSNKFSSAIEGVEITLKQSSDDTVILKVLLDVEQTSKQIESFVGFFNDAVAKINETLVGSRAFAGDINIQNIRNDLVEETQQNTKELDRRNEKISALNLSTENKKKIGLSIKNTEKPIQDEVAISSTLENIKRDLSFSARESDVLLERLTSFGIQSLEDDNFKVDPVELKRALAINTDEVLDLFLNEKTGILPQLKTKLDEILKEGLGDLDIKETKINISTSAPNILAKEFQNFFENRVFESTVQNLITVA